MEGDCIEACPDKAIRLLHNKLIIKHEVCWQCKTLLCTTNCPTSALKPNGYSLNVEELFSEITSDRSFWGDQGGITLSGGEPLLQIDFVTELLKRCNETCIHTALETCGQVPWSHFEAVMPLLDWIFFDLKHLNNIRHQEGTGSSNERLLENARQLAFTFKGRLIFRIPFIPSFNDSNGHLHDLAEFVKSTGRNEVNLLPLHHLGQDKYAKLQQPYLAKQYRIPTPEQLSEAQAIFNAHRIKCYIGNDTPF